jgi:DNA gyrase subunit B
VEKARYDKMLGHEEIRAMITALGCGIGKEDFDSSKLRYGKIILMTDADVDGSHIRTLLLTFFFRHMGDLIRRGHVYIAQPPLYRIKKGKFEQYIKDDREFVKVMIKRASDGMGLRYGTAGKKLEGSALTKFMGQLNEYLGVFEKANKHLRNQEVTELLPRFELMKRTDFEGDGAVPPKLAKLHAELQKMAKRFEFKAVAAPRYEEEHRTWSVSFTDSQGAERRVDWTLASSPEYRQMMAKYGLIREELAPPFVIEYAKAAEAEDGEADAPAETASKDTAAKPKKAKRAVPDPVTKQSAREVFEYVIEQGRRDYDVQRYKGLGEMTSSQLWETTMDPDRRTLLSVRLEDLAETESIFSTLMGEDVESRRKFIEDNALDVKNLDI